MENAHQLEYIDGMQCIRIFAGQGSFIVDASQFEAVRQHTWVMVNTVSQANEPLRPADLR